VYLPLLLWAVTPDTKAAYATRLLAVVLSFLFEEFDPLDCAVFAVGN
jgi:hypothetical protein